MRSHTIISSEHGDRCIEHPIEAVSCGIAHHALLDCSRCGFVIGYGNYFGHEFHHPSQAIQPAHFACMVQGLPQIQNKTLNGKNINNQINTAPGKDQVHHSRQNRRTQKGAHRVL